MPYTFAFLSMPGAGEFLVIFLVIFLFFGASRVPEIARSLGKGILEFKKALSGESEDKDKKEHLPGKDKP